MSLNFNHLADQLPRIHVFSSSQVDSLFESLRVVLQKHIFRKRRSLHYIKNDISEIIIEHVWSILFLVNKLQS